MTDAEGSFVERLESREETRLDRLGSEKALIAVTGADLSTQTVLRTVAAETLALEAVYADWAETTDGEVADAFADAAAAAGDRYDRLVADLETESDPDGAPVVDHLAAETDPVEQVAAGLVAYPLVAERTHLQVVSFFVNEADARRADQFRAFRTAAQERAEAGETLLGTVCEDEGDWNRADAAASALVEVAYEDYASTLEGLGLDPKPVC